MARIISNAKEYKLVDFESEQEFEKAVIENKVALFGPRAVYIDVKKRIGHKDSPLKGIPDAFLIDFEDIKNPQLYIVENELSSHDVYAHITEQIARFSATVISSIPQIREIILKVIRSSDEIQREIESLLKETPFKNIENLMLFLTEKSDIKIVVAINDITTDLNSSLKIFKTPPDLVLLQRYQSGGDILYFYEPMREELEDLEHQTKDNKESIVDFDTVVCAAFQDGFEHAYVQNNAWWAVRLSQEAREKLRYLAIYEKSPKAQIEHVAEVESIEPYKDTGKFLIHLKNKRTIKPIPLDRNSQGVAPQGPRFTTFAKLQQARKMSELWN
jgi:hypothetical protein